MNAMAACGESVSTYSLGMADTYVDNNLRLWW